MNDIILQEHIDRAIEAYILISTKIEFIANYLIPVPGYKIGDDFQYLNVYCAFMIPDSENMPYSKIVSLNFYDVVNKEILNNIDDVKQLTGIYVFKNISESDVNLIKKDILESRGDSI